MVNCFDKLLAIIRLAIWKISISIESYILIILYEMFMTQSVGFNNIIFEADFEWFWYEPTKINFSGG